MLFNGEFIMEDFQAATVNLKVQLNRDDNFHKSKALKSYGRTNEQ